MIRFEDYTCPECGHTKSDVVVDRSVIDDQRPTCSMCNTKMEKMIGGLSIKTNSRTERSYPTHLLGGGERARFDR
jgi:transposase-like protein